MLFKHYIINPVSQSSVISFSLSLSIFFHVIHIYDVFPRSNEATKAILFLLYQIHIQKSEHKHQSKKVE